MLSSTKSRFAGNKFTVITIATLLFSALQFAQAPDTLWTKTYGGASAEWGNFVQQTSDFVHPCICHSF